MSKPLSPNNPDSQKSHNRYWIAADIGGTKSLLCVVDANEQSVLHEQTYASADFVNFSALLTRFLEDTETASHQSVSNIEAMCLALPGVVKRRKSQLTNLDWILEEEKLQQQFSIHSVFFVNDFQAAAMGVSALKEEDIVTLNLGAAPDTDTDTDTDIENSTQQKNHKTTTEKTGITVVTGAGTGLGLAWMDHTENHHQLFPTEGGHCDFAPTNEQQIGLLRYLMKQYDHVSYERILSGAGLVQLYYYLSSDDESKAETNDISLKPQKISTLAQQGNPLAVTAIRLFVDIYAAYIGNLALLYKPAGGIYIAGGIATHILQWMQTKAFITQYFHKGRMQPIAEETPVYLVTNKRLGLLGAIQFCINKRQAPEALN